MKPETTNKNYTSKVCQKQAKHRESQCETLSLYLKVYFPQTFLGNSVLKDII